MPLPLRHITVLKPAVRTTSMVLIMLGVAMAVVVALVFWISTPESVSVAQVDLSAIHPDATFVRGGQSYVELWPYLRHELVSVLGLLLIGSLGLLVSSATPASAEMRSRAEN